MPKSKTRKGAGRKPSTNGAKKAHAAPAGGFASEAHIREHEQVLDEVLAEATHLYHGGELGTGQAVEAAIENVTGREEPCDLVARMAIERLLRVRLEV
ncbi:MAG: hypothetical protein A2148_08510 [Chloroflexi bacterium RBG_16_68_14]|nr:MAG: hypothetical protein A2148_08510 [Chloroflexi bacterium RBG_16_68_14]